MSFLASPAGCMKRRRRRMSGWRSSWRNSRCRPLTRTRTRRSRSEPPSSTTSTLVSPSHGMCSCLIRLEVPCVVDLMVPRPHCSILACFTEVYSDPCISMVKKICTTVQVLTTSSRDSSLLKTSKSMHRISGSFVVTNLLKTKITPGSLWSIFVSPEAKLCVWDVRLASEVTSWFLNLTVAIWHV